MVRFRKSHAYLSTSAVVSSGSQRLDRTGCLNAVPSESPVLLANNFRSLLARLKRSLGESGDCAIKRGGISAMALSRVPEKQVA